MKRLVWFGLFSLACDPQGVDASTADSTATEGEVTTGQTVGGTVDDATGTGSLGTAGGTDSGSDSGDGVDADSGSSGESGNMDGIGDCAALLAAEPDTPDGIYEFHPAGNTADNPFDAYCDMTTNGGGWTLVARSVESAEEEPWDVSFGWQSATGSVEDDAKPYSVDALAAKLEFSEVLVGSYGTGKVWEGPLYKLDAPPLFVPVYGQSFYPATLTPLAGDCDSEGSLPHHLQGIGWTADTSKVRFGEFSFDSKTGLFAGGFDLEHTVDNCGGGMLDTRQGMVMVR